MLMGLNHLTLAVTDLDASLAFYERLGFRRSARWRQGAYLELGNIWLCLALRVSVKLREDDSHIAFSTTQAGLHELRRVLPQGAIWQQNKSEGDSLYFVDPDGHKLEAHVGNLATRLAHLKENPYEALELGSA